jgi:hypothetical protein
MLGHSMLLHCADSGTVGQGMAAKIGVANLEVAGIGAVQQK